MYFQKELSLSQEFENGGRFMGRVNDWLRKARKLFLYFREGKVRKLKPDALIAWILLALLYSADIWILKIFRILK